MEAAIICAFATVYSIAVAIIDVVIIPDIPGKFDEKYPTLSYVIIYLIVIAEVILGIALTMAFIQFIMN